MKIFGFIGVFLASLSALAVNPNLNKWHRGELLFSDNQTVEGEIRYDSFTDLIQVKEENVIRVYSARQVNTFGFFDETTNQMRRFLSLTVPDRRHRNRKVFYEIVLTGEMYLLRRLHPRGPLMAASPSLTEVESPWYDRKNIFDYYTYSHNRLIPIRHFRKQIYSKIMGEYGEELQAFMAEKKLNLYTQRGKFMLINQYNILKDPSLITLF